MRYLADQRDKQNINKPAGGGDEVAKLIIEKRRSFRILDKSKNDEDREIVELNSTGRGLRLVKVI